MAKRGTVKALSVAHEAYIAKLYNGIRSPSSGGADRDRGDVRVAALDGCLYECKCAGTFDKPAKSIRVVLDDLEKVADEAWSEGKQFAMALRMYAPDSILAGSDGFVDLMCRTVMDDLNRD